LLEGNKTKSLEGQLSENKNIIKIMQDKLKNKYNE
jgi:hypothetical protein